jgi:16S rRNA (uracil1498-N3)-methyltransferase
VSEALVFVDDVEHPELSSQDRHHLERVLRLRKGAVITVSDGFGRHCDVTLDVRLEVEGPIEITPPPASPVAVGFALVKGERPELIVQKLTELGVDRIVPFVAERCVVRWDAAKRDGHLERLRRIAREAAMQSRRDWLPIVEPLGSFAELVSRPGVAMAERGAMAPGAEVALVLVGPEGGWSPTEREANVPTVGLGAHVLRVETAAIAAGVLLTAGRAARSGGTWWGSTVA